MRIQQNLNKKEDQLLNAIRKKDVQTIRQMVDEGLDLNHFPSGIPALFYVSSYGPPELVKPLVEMGANPNGVVAGFMKPLYFACQNTKYFSKRTVSALIEAGATPDFDVTARLGNIEAIEAILETHVKPTHREKILINDLRKLTEATENLDKSESPDRGR